MGKIKRKEVDLHIHSHYSDGDCSIEELVGRIKKAELRAAILTDHDTIEGAEKFLALCKEKDIASITGVEISSRHQFATMRGGYDAFTFLELHFLGYGFDLGKITENNLLYRNRVIRNHHVEDMMEIYRREGTLDVSFIEITNSFNIHWPIISKYWLTKYRALELKKQGEKISFKNAQRKAADEIKEGQPYNAPREKFAYSEEVIELIRSSGGIAVLAHPIVYLEKLEKIMGQKNALPHFEDVLKTFKNEGLYGLEVYAERNTSKDIKLLRKLCEKYDLDPNFGGSDYHGDKKNEHMPGLYLGKSGINYGQFLKIKEALKNNL